MTDAQILTLAFPIAVPLALLSFRNSRSNSRVSEAKETLRAEIAALRAGMTRQFEALQAKLVVDELEHHHN